MAGNGRMTTNASTYAILAGSAAMVVVYIVLKSILGVTTVIVAKRPIQVGARVTAGMIEERQMPVGAGVTGVYKNRREVLGRRVSTARLPGDYLSPQCFREFSVRVEESNAFAKDELVFLLPVTNVNAFAGLLRRGARINVIAVPSQHDPTALRCQTILTGVEVAQTAGNAQSESGRNAQGILVKVTKSESELLAEASSMGSIIIALAGYVYN